MPVHISYIIGPPGTGKTTKIAHLVGEAIEKYGQDRVSICSLTKAAAREAAGRVTLPEGHVSTLHSFAFHALGSHIAIAEKHAKEWNESYPYWPMDTPIIDLDDAPEERQSRQWIGDELLEEYGMLRARLLPVHHGRPLLRQFVTAWESWKAEATYKDFTDLFLHALRDTTMAPHAPAVLFVDEAQDLSQLEVNLLMHWARHLEELILVGDPYQNLYSWRGSDANVVFPPANASTFVVLSQSYRIPRAVHEVAVRWISCHSDYRIFTYAPREEEGEVRWEPWRLLQPETWIEQLGHYAQRYERVMVIASCAYMIRPLVAVLRQAGIPFHNPWRLKSRAWNPLAVTKGTPMIERVLGLLQRETDGYWTPKSLRAWLEPLRAEGVFQHGKRTTAITPREDMTIGDVLPLLEETCLPVTYAFLRDASMTHLLAWWEAHLTAKAQESAQYPLRIYRKYGIAKLIETPHIILGTIHSLKGSEADVVLLAPDISRAAFQEWMFGGEGRDAVLRQFYVGITRAKERLILLAPSTRLALEIA